MSAQLIAFNLGDKLGKAVSGSFGSADLTLLWEAAQNGDREAQFKLGFLYEHGEGVEQSYKTAINLYRKAAEQGHPEAQYNLGYFYECGAGTDQDFQEAASWYEKAAQQGFAEAQNNLGVLYSLGKGVRQDLDIAAQWYTKADAGRRLNPPWSNWVGPSPRDKLTKRPG